MILDFLITGFYGFARTCAGIITRPYETYRRIVTKGNKSEFLPIGLLLASYFVLASLVKTAAFRPYLLTRHFVVLTGTAMISFLVASWSLYIAGKLIGGIGSYRRLVLAWGYTMIPTVLWFFMTSLLYVILPPPRTTQITGIVFSVLYLIISSVLLFWKLILSYLTLRFSLRLDLLRILVAVVLAGPVVGAWSYLVYKLGIFKVPFI